MENVQRQIQFLPGHWTDATIAFEAVDFSNVRVTQFKVENIEVGCNTIFGNGFGNDNVATLNLVADQNLGRRLVELSGNGKNLLNETM